MMDEISISSNSSTTNIQLEKDKPPALLLNLCTEMAKTIHDQVLIIIGQSIEQNAIA